jgi:trimeric autotransporter adhesin
MKKIIPALSALILTLSLSAASYAQTSTTVVNPPAGTTTEVTNTAEGQTIITVTVNNENVAFEKNELPVMIGGRVMVPLRGVVERLGGNIKYDATSKVITGAQPNLEKQFRLRVGNPSALLNGKEMSLDTPPRVLSGVTYVPLRFVSEAMGADVRWDSDKRTVTIMADGYSAAVKTNP